MILEHYGWVFNPESGDQNVTEICSDQQEKEKINLYLHNNVC